MREPQKKFRKREFQQRVPKRRAEKEPQRGIREKIQKNNDDDDWMDGNAKDDKWTNDQRERDIEMERDREVGA